MEQVESPEINPYIYGLLIKDKEGKNTQCRKDSFFNKYAGKTEQPPCKRMKLEHSLTPYIQINPKWVKDLNLRPDTMKLLEENIDRLLFDINHRNWIHLQD